MDIAKPKQDAIIKNIATEVFNHMDQLVLLASNTGQIHFANVRSIKLLGEQTQLPNNLLALLISAQGEFSKPQILKHTQEKKNDNNKLVSIQNKRR